MKTSSKSNRPKAKVVGRFRHAVNVEILMPRFVPLASVASQDVQKLSKGRHKIEVGFMEGGCCPKLVRAVIGNGMVTGFEVDPCEDSEKVLPKAMSKDTAQLVAKARRLVGQNEWEATPVREFVKAVAQQTGSYPDRIGWGAGCIYICHGFYCLFCCFNIFSGPFGCWIERRKPDVEM
jgi:hypothetical protein